MNTVAWDVVVVGAGNAAMCAALTAREQGAKVLVLERAPEGERGGNSTYTAGAMRFAYRGLDDILALVPEMSEEETDQVDFGSYTSEQFLDDLRSVTNYHTDLQLAETLVFRSFDTMKWMRSKGVHFDPAYQRQAFKVDGKMKFWGGLALVTRDGGPGLTSTLHEAAAREGIEVWYESRGLSLLHDDDGVYGIRVRRGGKTREVYSRTVVLASGGFEANAEMRTRYMGPGWDTAKVRGTRFNTGDGIRMALKVGAMPWGQWSGGHAVFWDKDAPPFGDLEVSNAYSKLSYPFGIVVNANGERFVDEGANFRNYTYAKYGRELLRQPGGFGWQVFDAKVASLLSNDYRTRQVTKVTSDTLEGLATQLKGVNTDQFLATVREYNGAVLQEVPFNPTIKDKRGTQGIAPAKSNWANRIDTPPFEAYAVTCGITFTFGGLRIIPETAQVLDTEEKPIPNLFAAGELVGGLFYDNYPGGSGLTSGSVFGRIAGKAASCVAKQVATTEAR